ncbi:MAG: APC family permease [Intestinimonas sp.]|nr:APC family permease [Intestinimonas sp.]
MKGKKLGLGSGVAVCVGLIVATSCLVSLGTGIGLAGKAFIIPLFIVMILNSFIALSFGELHRMMPGVDGGTGQYLLTSFGPVPSIVGNVSAYVITMVLASTAELAMCGVVLCQLFFPGLDPRIISMLVLAFFFIINCFGVDVFSKVQNLVVILLIGSMALFGILGSLGLGTGTLISAAQQSAPAVSGFGPLMSLSALAFWLYIGVEFVIPVAKDMKNPKRDVLLAMMLGLVLLFVVQAVLGNAMANYVDLSVLAADPSGTPHMTFAENLFGAPGKYWMGFVTILAAVSTMNTVYVSTSKILMGMAEEGMMPKVLSKTNHHGAAVNGLILMGVLDAALLLSNIAMTSGITFVILAASCFWLVTYILIHASVLVLRHRYPNAPRNKKLTFAGIPQIVGILGNIYMIWFIADGDTRILIFKIFGVLFALLVVYAFVWTCGVMKAKPFKPVDLAVINAGKTTFEELVTYDANPATEQS